jgi:hypothetical protein
VYTPPPEQIPSAPAAPHPTQPWPTSSWFAPHTSAHVPAVVRQPPVPASHPAAQHWFEGPTPHVVTAAVHVHALHTSAVPLQYRVHVAG